MEKTIKTCYEFHSIPFKCTMKPSLYSMHIQAKHSWEKTKPSNIEIKIKLKSNQPSCIRTTLRRESGCGWRETLAGEKRSVEKEGTAMR